MEDKSTPDVTGADAGGQNDHSQDASQTTADDKGTESTDATTKSDQTTDKGDGAGGDKKTDTPTKSDEDDDLDQWAEKSGLGKLETDKERKLAQIARDNKREFHSKTQSKQAAADVDKTIAEVDPNKSKTKTDFDDPLERKVADLEAANREERELRQRSEYFAENKVTPEESTAMQAILKEKVDKAPDHKKEAVFNFLSDPDNLAEWHEMAKARLATGTGDDVADAVREEERERLAKLSQTKSPERSATSTVPKGQKSDDERRNEMWKTPAGS